MKVCDLDKMSTLKRPAVVAAVCLNFLVVTYTYFQAYVKFPTKYPQKFHTFGIPSHDVHEVLRDNRNIKEQSMAVLGTPFSSKLPSTLAPECANILNNMTHGRWVRKIDLPRYRYQISLLTKDQELLESELRIYWVKRGIQTAFWREDFRCGYYNYESQPPNTRWKKVGSWCDPKGEKPCCTNIMKGTCMKPSKATCNCTGCVDLRTYKYAEFSEWIVADDKCKWKEYNSSEICRVIEDSRFSDIHFVGDSFVRNMFRTFAMMVTDDFNHGAVNESTSLPIRKLCQGMQQYFWKECRKTLQDLSKTLYPTKLCGGRGYLNFNATRQDFYSTKFKADFLKFVKSKINVPGTLIVVSIGFHMQCTSSKAIDDFLDPAVKAITQHYGTPPVNLHPNKLSGRWPQILLCLPLTIGLLKPTPFLNIQNEIKCDKYCSKMKAYSRMHDIRVLDFRELTKLVLSFDGTHHGMNVNKMKNQILLNYIASLT